MIQTKPVVDKLYSSEPIANSATYLDRILQKISKMEIPNEAHCESYI